MLRVVGGKYRHRLLSVPSGDSTRPTTDKVREALMSALGVNLIDAVILDLFAGSGALGIESLSRGASKVYFCDNNYNAIKTIKLNISTLNIEEEIEVISTHYMSALKQFKERNVKFDIVYLDPPYIKQEVYQEVTNFLLDNNLLSDDGIIVKEWNQEIPVDERFSYHKAYKYGSIHILIERK